MYPFVVKFSIFKLAHNGYIRRKAGCKLLQVNALRGTENLTQANIQFPRKHYHGHTRRKPGLFPLYK